MSDYAIFFDRDGITYRIPVNPEEIEKTSILAIERYEVLKLGQIAIPSHMELTEYSFEVEFPHNPMHYVETSGSFKEPDFYLNLFRKWREELVPVRFIASNGIGDDINTLILIEEVREVEKVGEEGDKYVSFNLLEYREYGKKTVSVSSVTSSMSTGTAVKVVPEKTNPKSTGFYIVKNKDTLWAIAKRFYGNGAKYTKIYNANKDKIKNPALIYPGQKLVIPK